MLEEGAVMDKPDVTHIVLRQCRSSASYNEQETLEASHLGIGTVRILRASGLVEGQEMAGELRYSEEEVIRLRQIRRLQHDLGVNLAGVEVILHLLKQLENLRRELEQERKSHEY
jgi:MerR family transcriptional regulator/heat shock protein HspR